MKKNKILLIIFLLLVLSLFFILKINSHSPEKTYGVFLSIDGSQIQKLQGYETVVIDAQYFTKEQIAELKASGTTVYSYLNVGSIETFRDYYDTYSSLILGKYDNWEEESWIDVSAKQWQSQISSLSQDFLEKGIDGFFVDNCDVYYQYPEEKIYHGLCLILQELTATGKDVIINGGDVFIQTYMEQNDDLSPILSGINQECVFSAIDFENNSFHSAQNSDREYYLSYLKKAQKRGATIYLLEYTTDSHLQKEIRAFCKKQHWNYYISNSIELD